MKTFIIVVVFSLATVFAVNLGAFDGSRELRLVSDSFFVVGIFMFFIGLIGTIGAGDIFKASAYTFKNMFRRHTVAKSFYEDSKQKVTRVSKEMAVSVFITGIILVVISLIIT
jgi:uncharacterized membrane protein